MVENIVAEYSVRIYPPRMRGIGEIVKSERKAKGLNQKELADLSGINTETLVRLEAGVNVGIARLYAVAKALGKKVGFFIPEDEREQSFEMISADDRILMISNELHRALHRKLQEILDVDDDIAFGITVNVNSLHKDAIESRKPKREVAKSNIVKMPKAPDYPNIDSPQPAKFVLVRHFDRIPAGDPREMAPGSGGEWSDIVHSVAKDTWYTLRVWGDSMEPKYYDGDIVLMDMAKQPRNGDDVAALVKEDEGTLKRYRLRGGVITLSPLNTAKYEPHDFPQDGIRIQGVVIEIVRRKARD